MMATRVGLDYEKIVQAAAELADAGGLHELTMATLASHVGVRPPTLYHYFPGLAGLRRALALLGLREMFRRLGRAVMGKAGDDAVLALTHALRHFAKEHPGLYEATVRAPDAEDREWQQAANETLDIALRSLVAYRLSQDDALHAVRMIRSIVHGCVSLENAGAFGLPLEVDETFRRLLSALLSYLHKSQETEA
jgi:AcrR family transcriptional regulator